MHRGRDVIGDVAAGVVAPPVCLRARSASR
jgi:hypothetical protein